jgi:hypothetical protein
VVVVAGVAGATSAIAAVEAVEADVVREAEGWAVVARLEAEAVQRRDPAASVWPRGWPTASSAGGACVLRNCATRERSQAALR